VADIVLINPRFDVSFWGLEHVLPYLGKRANMPPGSLPLLAALTPAQHRVTLIDANVEAINFDKVAQADIVGVTGLNVQRLRMREILTELKERGAFTVVGGPWVTVQEDYFGDMADAIFVGEAEETWPRFLRDCHEGRPQAAAPLGTERAARPGDNLPALLGEESTPSLSERVGRGGRLAALSRRQADRDTARRCRRAGGQMGAPQSAGSRAARRRVPAACLWTQRRHGAMAPG